MQMMFSSHSMVQHTRTTVLWPWRTLVKMILPCSVWLTLLLVAEVEDGSVLGQWFFPNGTKLPSIFVNQTSQPKLKWDLYRTREKMMVLLHRRRGGVAGIYYCEIPDSMNITQTIYIGVYNTSTGEWHCVLLFCFNSILLCLCCDKEEIEVREVKVK